MFLSFLAFVLFQLYRHTTALPAGPPGQNTDGTLILPNPADGNLSTIYTTLVFLNNTVDNSSHVTLGAPSPRRPRGSKVYPEGRGSGKYWIRFYDYGRDVSEQDGVNVLHKAAHEVDDWILAAKKHSYTPVEQEHSWRSGSVELSVKPNSSGYILGDLKSYLALITAFHGKYGMFWEWEAQLVEKVLIGVAACGSATLKIH
ncbi:MAG: hypothetical protein L6R39_006831 [Caloplaca ligustica]|nr:MAG: hypothetical protein L6R39_006831 [Caloplaca ligustica]